MWDQSWIWSLHYRSKTKNVSSFLTLVGLVVLHSVGFLSGKRKAVPVEHISCLPCAPTDPHATHGSAPWITVSSSTTTLRALDQRTMTRKHISKPGVSSFTQIFTGSQSFREKETPVSPHLPTTPTWMALSWVLLYSWRSFKRHLLPKYWEVSEKSTRARLFVTCSCYRIQRQKNPVVRSY